MKNITPHVSSGEEIVNYPQISEGVNEVSIMPIVASRGQITPQIVGNRDLLNMYVGADGIKRSDDLSLKLAFILSKVTNLIVCRVSNTEILSGVAIKMQSNATVATKIYVKDGSYYSDAACETAYDTTGTAFIVYSLAPSDSDNCKVIINSAYSQKGVSSITLTDGVFTETYDFSLDLDYINGYGESLYIERINSLQSYFKIDAIADMSLTVLTANNSFGNSGYNPSCVTYTAEGTVTNAEGTDSTEFILAAINKLAKFRRDLKVKFFYDGQLVNNPIAEAIQNAAKKRKALGVISTPIKADTFAKVKSFCSNVLGSLVVTDDKQSSYLYNCSPSRVDTQYFGWRETLPYSLYYMLTVYSNASSSLEYAPVYGPQSGSVIGTNITIPYEHSTDEDEIGLPDDDPDLPETEALQRLSDNPVIYDAGLGVAYFVNNLTLQTPNLNQLSEENNRRLFNSIQFDINRELDEFLASKNNQVTRDEIGEMLDDYKMTVLDKLGYGLSTNDQWGGFRYDITPYNPARRNTIQLTVEVCFSDSVKYIQVLYRNVAVMS